MVVQKTLEITNRLGLHARAAAQFVQVAGKYASEVFVTKDGFEVNGKSIMGILMLAAPKGTIIEIRVEGEDAQDAMDGLGKLIHDKFGED